MLHGGQHVAHVLAVHALAAGIDMRRVLGTRQAGFVQHGGHGGTIAAENRPGTNGKPAGARFIVRLPLG